MYKNNGRGAGMWKALDARLEGFFFPLNYASNNTFLQYKTQVI